MANTRFIVLFVINTSCKFVVMVLLEFTMKRIGMMLEEFGMLVIHLTVIKGCIGSILLLYVLVEFVVAISIL